MRSFALGAALLLAASTVHASPEDLFGYGGRSQGMGATGAASAEGYEAAYANPALLSRMRERSAGFVYAASKPVDDAAPVAPIAGDRGP